MLKNKPIIISGMKDPKRCDYCGRLCYGYHVVEKREVDLEDNSRRPADYKKEVSEIQ